MMWDDLLGQSLMIYDDLGSILKDNIEENDMTSWHD